MAIRRKPSLRKKSEGAGTRTQDQRIKSPLLYQLSYTLSRRRPPFITAINITFAQIITRFRVCSIRRVHSKTTRQRTSGADRIRTCGTGFPVHRFSKPALSTTQPPPQRSLPKQNAMHSLYAKRRESTSTLGYLFIGKVHP